MTTPSTIGVLLAGGLARRMGGGDKPLRRLAGSTILEPASDGTGRQPQFSRNARA